MEFDIRVEDLLKEILHFLETSLKDVFFPAIVLEEKFRLIKQVGRALQTKNVRTTPERLKALPDSLTSMGSSTNSLVADGEAILRSGHKHRNAMVLDEPRTELRRSGSVPRSDSGCHDSVSQFSDEIQDLKRVSLASTSSGESTATRREDDTASIRSSLSNVQLQTVLEGSLPTYEEAESRAFFTGTIKKKFGIVPSWRTYAGVICDCKLLLYCSSKTGTPKLVVPLESYEVRAASVSKKRNNFEFVIVGAGKQTYKFRTETEDDLSSWVRSLEYALRSVSISGVTEDETSDLPIEEADNRLKTEIQREETPKFDILSDMKKLEEYESMRIGGRNEVKETERDSIVFEIRDLPSIPTDDFYDDIGGEVKGDDENIYDMPNKATREEIYDVPSHLDSSKRSSAGTDYDSPEELVYDTPNVSSDPTEIYDIPKFSYDSPQPQKPPLSAKTKSPKRSESLNDAFYNIPRNIYEVSVYDHPNPVPSELSDKKGEAVKFESKIDIKPKIPRQLSFSGGSALFKDELELKLKRNRDNENIVKNKKDFMYQLLDEAPEEGRFIAYPAIVEPVSPLKKQASPLADVFTNARNVFLQKTERLKTPPRLNLESTPLIDTNVKSPPPTPTKLAPPRPPAPAFRGDGKESLKKESQGRSPPPPLISPVVEEIYEDIDQGQYAEPEVYVARWAYIASSEKELSLRKGETVYVLNKNSKESWLCKNAKSQGFVPPAYLAKAT